MSKIDPNKPLPEITHRTIVARSKFFRIEQVDLTFSNGATRQFERMAGKGHGAVMIVPFYDDDHILLIREYGAGTHQYELGFPKGLIDAGETPFQAANRELKEEAGYGANDLSDLINVSMAPTFFNAKAFTSRVMSESEAFFSIPTVLSASIFLPLEKYIYAKVSFRA